MQLVAQPQQKLAGRAQLVAIVFRRAPAWYRVLDLGFSIAGKADPAHELNVAQSAAGGA